MTVNIISDSQRKAAKLAGLAYLLTFTTVVAVNFGIFARLLVSGNAPETARNILTHETLFRLGIAGNIVYCAGIVVLLTALFVALEPVNRGLALLAAFSRLVWVLMWLMTTLNYFDALRLLKNANYLRAFEPERLQVLARFYLGTPFDYYYVGLLFGAFASTVCAYLWLKSRFVPRVMALFGVIASAFCVACTLVFYIFPAFARIVNLWWFDTPMALFEITLSVWLLIKGLQPAQAGQAGTGSDRAQVTAAS